MKNTKCTNGSLTAKSLDEYVTEIQAIRDAAAAVRDDAIVLCHGGPLAEPDDAAYILQRTHGVVGFFGASSMERLPTEVAITENMRRFKALQAGDPADAAPTGPAEPPRPANDYR